MSVTSIQTTSEAKKRVTFNDKPTVIPFEQLEDTKTISLAPTQAVELDVAQAIQSIFKDHLASNDVKALRAISFKASEIIPHDMQDLSTDIAELEAELATLQSLYYKLNNCKNEMEQNEIAQLALDALFEQTQVKIPEKLQALRRSQETFELFARIPANKDARKPTSSNAFNVSKDDVFQVPWHLLATTTGVIGLLALGYLKTR